MHIDELIEQKKNPDLPQHPARKLRILRSALLGAAVFAAALIVVALLMLHKPSGFNQPKAINDSEVSKYLTHVISQDLYNGAQRGEPFDLVVSEEGIADIIARSAWPKQLAEASFNVPEVKFEPGRILLRGLVSFNKVELFVVITGTGRVDEQGLLHLGVTRVKIGAVTVTALAKLVTASIYGSEQNRRDLRPDDWQAKIMTALLLDKPFDPVFEIDKAKIRIDRVKIESGRITIHFVPAQAQIPATDRT
jgi:hypothetical protein